MTARLDRLGGQLQKLIANHDQKWNISGVPYKGQKKRVVETVVDEDPFAVTLPEGSIKTKAALAPDHTVPCGKYELLVKGKDLWVHALDDVVLSGRQPLCQMWGEFVTGSTPSEKKAIAKNKSKMFPVLLTSVESEAYFSMDVKKAVPEFSQAASKLSAFLLHLEENGFAAFTVEIHQLQHRIESNPGYSGPGSSGPGSSGPAASTYTIQPTGECFFHPLEFPPNKKDALSRDNIASIMDFDGWDFPAGKHTKNKLKLVPHWRYRESDNVLLPIKPQVFLTQPLRMAKGSIGCLSN